MTTIQTLPDHLTQLLSSKGQLGLTFAEIAEKIGKPEVWTAAVFYGQAVPDEATAQKLLDILRIGSAVEMNALLGKTTGVRGMVERGAGWECPPKVRLPLAELMAGPCTLPPLRSAGGLWSQLQGVDC
jgi:cyanate lyase